MPQFILLLHESPTYADGLSPEQMQALFGRYRDWGKKLREQGRIAASSKLKDGEGRVLRKNGSKAVVTDGPYAESKEVIGGYYVIEADNYDHAVETARECPHIDLGAIEIRQLDKV